MLKIKNLIIQIIKFGFVGVIAFVIDIGILMLLSEIFHIDVLVSSAISFSVSVIANYILSMRFVFRGKIENRLKEFAVFVALSIGGLCINEGIMWFGTKAMNVHYLAVKIFATIFVPIYNFVTRKIFLETK